MLRKTFHLVRGTVKIRHPHAAEPDGRDQGSVFAERLLRNRGVSGAHKANLAAATKDHEAIVWACRRKRRGKASVAREESSRKCATFNVSRTEISKNIALDSDLASNGSISQDMPDLSKNRTLLFEICAISLSESSLRAPVEPQIGLR